MLYTDEAMERERVHRLMQPAPEPPGFIPWDIKRELPIFQPCKKYMKGVKFPPINKRDYPVLQHTLVQVTPGRMILRWINTSDPEEWKEERKEVYGEIMGHCNMCLPSRTIKALFRILDGNPIIFSEDQPCQITTITTIDSVIRIKGIDKEEWPGGLEKEVNQ